MAWIGVDFDGTLALHPDPERPWPEGGRPIDLMVLRVKDWLEEGWEVRVVTARVSGDPSNARKHRMIVEQWCQDVFGKKLTVTCCKDYDMVELWDDRAVAVLSNTGQVLGGERE